MGKFSLLLLATLVASAVLAAETDDTDTDKAIVSGIVVDTEGHGVPGIELRAVDCRATPVRTDAGGRFSLTLKEQCHTEACVVASDDTGGRMGMWQTRRDGVTLIPRTVEIRIELRPSIAVKVEVVDAKRAPVPDARVVGMHSSLTAVSVAQTDAAGVATLRLPDSTDLTHIFAVKSGAGFDYLENFTTSPSPLADPPPAEAKLTLQGARATQFQAFDKEGKPVAGVGFYPSYFRMAGEKLSLTLNYAARAGGLVSRTDATGTATMDWLPSNLMSARFAGNSVDYRLEQDVTWTTGRNARADATPMFKTTVLHTQLLSGKVLRPDGSPAVGIMVKIQGSGRTTATTLRVTTRKDGTFALRVGSQCSYMLAVVDDQWGAGSLGGVAVKEGEDRGGLTFQLRPGTRVSGLVTDRIQGKPLPHALVTVSELGPLTDAGGLPDVGFSGTRQESLTRWVETDAQGQYSIRLGPGTYRFQIYNRNVRVWPETRIDDQAEIKLDLAADPPG